MSATSAAINPKGPRLRGSASNPFDWLNTYLGSSVGQKILVAITGLLLMSFAVTHMVGNLKMFSGPESINKYAYFLKHDIGAWIWVARAGLFLVFVLHLSVALSLKTKAMAARPVGYAYNNSAQATPQSKTMVQTGIVVGLFIIFHLLHYTFGMVHGIPAADGKGERNYLSLTYKLDDGVVVHDVYKMVVAGFSTGWLSAIYLISQMVLFIHLSHGIQSSLQTLGLVNRRFLPVARLIGYGTAGVIFVGNVAIVVAVWVGWVKM
ncbi:succinate dehydrogenase cytochrome b subunit [Limnoglobus roseus]|uniref:Succinate:quinone oxidoreductase n=1 Tax=Limnoglobus roseus TaxID=2598579 RepID=A0A5C1ATV4_9BACT|nr:succinate dehydrogenase cytochrome b subunit [Limnoglobus roseus]QEL21032.1 succinate:quinone oxidoreductase [Limnoglobus roseus]